MEELIKEAKWLYFQIENTQEKLVKSRLRNEKDNEHTALMELETEMCATLQLLKCLIERKDNIVDLGEVWHDKKIKPDENSEIVIIDDDEELYNISYAYDYYYDSSGKGWESCVRLFEIVKWAYFKDLLPKGGE